MRTSTQRPVFRTPGGSLPELPPDQDHAIAAAVRALYEATSLDGELIGYTCLVKGLELARPRARAAYRGARSQRPEG
jgi:hypothetical protein